MSEQSSEKKRKFLPIVIVGLILAALCGISLYLRAVLPHDVIFVKDWVWFRETDAYYYMRNIETLVHNFPHFNIFDPYQLYPGGATGLLRPFFAWLVAGVILLVKGGAATVHAMEAVAVYATPILGTLTLIPVYFIGKELFNRWAGVIAAALVVLIPGEFMHRSLLGFTDHHIAEALFSTVAVLFLIMAIKRAREREISFAHILSRDWRTIRRPLVYALLAGIFLGIYLLTWTGGLLFIFIIFAYLVIQFIVDHVRHKSTDYLCIIGTPLFFIAYFMLLPILGVGSFDIYHAAMLIAIVIPIALAIVSRLMARKALKPVYYPLTLLALTGIGLAALHAIDPSLLQSMLSKFGVFAPRGAMLTVMEVSPLLFPNGQFSLIMAWSNFNTSFFIGLVSLGMLIYVAIKGKGGDKILFLVWSIVMLLAVLGQRRFAYYYTINAALLTGYFSWKVLDVAGLSKLLTKSKAVVEVVKKFKKTKKKTKEKAKPKTFMEPRGAWVRVIVVGIVLFAIVFLPSIPSAKALAGSPNMIMDEGWYTSLLWLRDNSPDPFGDPDFYYELYKTPFHYPESAYGVMSWWDYGHFIMQIAHRIPNANPGQAGAIEAGQFFTALNETAANEVADNEGTKYVVIDYMMTTSKFYAMAEWANKSADDFYGIYYIPTEEGGQMAMLYYPAYYETTVARLYNFDGKNVTPVEPVVISYEDKVATGGQKYKEITSGQPFPTYEEARAYVANQTSGNWRIVGVSPFGSILPLEQLKSYELVHQSNATIPIYGQTVSTVKIFEYLGSGGS
jgi:oligosaccharyl transferase (archaeosortase A-associated)